MNTRATCAALRVQSFGATAAAAQPPARYGPAALLHRLPPLPQHPLPALPPEVSCLPQAVPNRFPTEPLVVAGSDFEYSILYILNHFNTSYLINTHHAEVSGLNTISQNFLPKSLSALLWRSKRGLCN